MFAAAVAAELDERFPGARVGTAQQGVQRSAGDADSNRLAPRAAAK
jgi:hypothetical protein